MSRALDSTSEDVTVIDRLTRNSQVGTRITDVATLLERMVKLLERIDSNTTSKGEKGRLKTLPFTLSNAQTSASPPYPRNLVLGIYLSADYSGRATLNWGADSFPLVISSVGTFWLAFTEATALEIPGGSNISVTPPAGSVVWDLRLIITPGGPGQ